MQPESIYRYQSAREFLKDSIALLKQTDDQFSIRKFCKQTGFGSHAYLVMILRDKRTLTLKQVPPLAKGLCLSSAEQMYLQTLIQLDNARSEQERDLCKLWLHDLNPNREYRTLEIEQYHLIADWVHMAILTLAKIDGAVIKAENIFALIHQKVSMGEIRNALERLLDLGLLRDEGGKLVPTHHSVTTKNDISNRGVREYHRQVSKLAAEALEEQDPAIREFQAFALTLPREKISLAKDLLRKFRHQMVQLLEAEPGYEVYQCNLQFFKLVDSPLNLVDSKVTSTAHIMSASSATHQEKKETV